MKPNKVLSLLGIAAKSGNVVSGEFSTEKAVKEGKGSLVIVSTDASENTKKKFRNMCDFYKVTMYEYAAKEDLGRSIGKEFRASLCVLDHGLADALQKRIEAEKTE